LSLNDNQIVDITPLANLSNLETLNLSYNQIKDFSALKNDPKITDCSGCKLTEQDF